MIEVILEYAKEECKSKKGKIIKYEYKLLIIRKITPGAQTFVKKDIRLC